MAMARTPKPVDLGAGAIQNFNEKQAMADYEAATPGLKQAAAEIDEGFQTRYCRDCKHMQVRTDYTHGPAWDEARCMHPALGHPVSGKPQMCSFNRISSGCGAIGQYYEPKE